MQNSIYFVHLLWGCLVFWIYFFRVLKCVWVYECNNSILESGNDFICINVSEQEKMALSCRNDVENWNEKKNLIISWQNVEKWMKLDWIYFRSWYKTTNLGLDKNYHHYETRWQLFRYGTCHSQHCNLSYSLFLFNIRRKIKYIFFSLRANKNNNHDDGNGNFPLFVIASRNSNAHFIRLMFCWDSWCRILMKYESNALENDFTGKSSRNYSIIDLNEVEFGVF